MTPILLNQTDTELDIQPLAFSLRILRCYKEEWLLYVLFPAIFLFMGSLQAAAYLLCFFLIIKFPQYWSRRKYLLVKMLRSGDTIRIEYVQGDDERMIEDDKSKFWFEKKQEFLSKTRSIYLAIYYDDKLLLKQFPIEDLKETTFDHIIEKYA